MIFLHLILILMIMNMNVNRWSAHENDQDCLLYRFLEIMLINELTTMHNLHCALTCRYIVLLHRLHYLETCVIVHQSVRFLVI